MWRQSSCLSAELSLLHSCSHAGSARCKLCYISTYTTQKLCISQITPLPPAQDSTGSALLCWRYRFPAAVRDCCAT